MSADHYSELGVSRSAGDDEIKKAYRKLARELHPDVNPDDADAESRFKRVSEAYSVLSDPAKRSLYDRYGDDGLRDGFDAAAYERMRAGYRGQRPGQAGGFEVNLEDLFGSGGFGGFGGGAPFGGSSSRGRDLELTLRVDFTKAATGFKTTFTYGRPTRCTACRGGGVIGQAVCASCGGSGQVERPTTLNVNVPEGAADGDRIRLKGKGADGRTGPAGDAILVIAVDPHPTLRREGLNLVTSAVISPVDAILGGRVDVEGIAGKIRVVVPPRVASGKRLRVAGKGVRRKGAVGDLLVEVQIDGALVPNTDEVRQLAEKLRDAVDSSSQTAPK